MDAVRRYLKEDTALLTNIMLIMYLRGWQAPRTTELLSVECYNDPSTPCGVYIHDGSLVLVTRHYNARRSTNQEFNIARYLPDEDSKLIVAYLTYIRPLVALLRRVCLGQKQDRRLLFASSYNAKCHWKSDNLTSTLKTVTADIADVSFGLQIYRQISIAFTEKHVKHIARPFNRYDDTRVAADIEVVFAWQSGRRPVQRRTSSGMDGAFPDSLQPALLSVYRWISVNWHRFVEGQGHASSMAVQSLLNCRSDHASFDGADTINRTVLPNRSDQDQLQSLENAKRRIRTPSPTYNPTYNPTHNPQ